jgi:N-acetylmuramoyl-L-alanine amidase
VGLSNGRPDVVRVWAILGVLTVLAMFAGACGDDSISKKDVKDDDLERARAMLDPSAPLAPRPLVISRAQAIAARAAKESTPGNAVALRVLAAQLIERVWRNEHREQDAKEAIDLYRAAAQDMSQPGACDAALGGAHLSGEAGQDASTTYAEVYRASKRNGVPAPCKERLDKELAFLVAFRPPPSVLDAIDRGVEGEGALDRAADAGLRVSVAPKVKNVEQWAGPEGARVVVTLDAPARYQAGDEPSQQGKGGRTYVELFGVDLNGPARDVKMGGIVSGMRAEPTSTGARVALDLTGPGYRKVFHLVEPFRVVIDVAKNIPGGNPKGKRAVARVVVDPGHGGTDPGAIGPTGVHEADVTLDIAHKVAPALSALGIQVTLTRDDDRFITLEERTARANGFGADLFVSIHCNAAENHTRHGVETYVLDTTTSEIAARVAARENATSQAANLELGSILANMRLADQASRSNRLAELLQKSALSSLATDYKDVTDGGVHTAGFYVLVGARMPAVLFETSYISHPEEEKRLASDAYKGRLADAIVNAVKAYREGR